MRPEEVKRVREMVLNYTQEELADLLGRASKTVISGWETGERNPDRLAATVLKILDNVSPQKRKELIELLKRHQEKR